MRRRDQKTENWRDSTDLGLVMVSCKYKLFLSSEFGIVGWVVKSAEFRGSTAESATARKRRLGQEAATIKGGRF